MNMSSLVFCFFYTLPPHLQPPTHLWMLFNLIFWKILGQPTEKSSLNAVCELHRTVFQNVSMEELITFRGFFVIFWHSNFRIKQEFTQLEQQSFQQLTLFLPKKFSHRVDLFPDFICNSPCTPVLSFNKIFSENVTTPLKNREYCAGGNTMHY